MNVGDQVRVRAGVANGRVGTVVSLHGQRVKVRVEGLKALADSVVTVMWTSVEPLQDREVRVATFRPWVPEPFRVPRPGSEVASRLPSLHGGQQVYPRGLQA